MRSDDAGGDAEHGADGEYSQPMRSAAVALAVIVAATVLVSQAVGATPFKRKAVPGQGMSLSVPATWKSIDATLPAQALRELERQNPKLAPYIRQLSGPNAAAKFLAFDPALRGGFATNVNVVAVTVPNVTFAQYRAALVSEIRSISGSTPRSAVVTIAGQRALRLDYRLTLNAGTSITVQTLQYAFLRPGRRVVVTYTTLPSQRSRYAPSFTRSAASIRFS